jgi:hypothetical protein
LFGITASLNLFFPFKKMNCFLKNGRNPNKKKKKRKKERKKKKPMKQNTKVKTNSSKIAYILLSTLVLANSTFQSYSPLCSNKEKKICKDYFSLSFSSDTNSNTIA